jgi:hypothetical protein
MGCFSSGAIENFLIWLVIVCIIVGVCVILVPWILSLAGVVFPDPLRRIINLIVLGFVIIAVILVVFWLLSCMVGFGFSHR